MNEEDSKATVGDLKKKHEEIKSMHRTAYFDLATKCRVPYDVAASLSRYIVDFIPTGGFLEACISNQLSESFAHADDTNIHFIKEIVHFLHSYAPMFCWGAPERYRDWINLRYEEHVPWSVGVAEAQLQAEEEEKSRNA